MRTLTAWTLFAYLCVCSSPVWAFDPNAFAHTPPTIEHFDANAALPMIIPAAGVKRARILLAKREGYQLVPMERMSDSYMANLRFEDLATLKYQFQLETEEGRYFESAYYSIRQPASEELEKSVKQLEETREALIARKQQLTNTVSSIRNTDPKSLAQRKQQELARALLVLGSKEREYAELQK